MRSHRVRRRLRRLGLRDRHRDEAGVVSVWTILAGTVTFLLMLGLVVDGGNAINDRVSAKRVAEQAARAAADEMRGARNANETVDAAAAAGRARGILARAGWAGSVQINGVDVEVAVRGRSPTIFLTAIGVGSFPVAETGSATAITGPR